MFNICIESLDDKYEIVYVLFCEKTVSEFQTKESNGWFLLINKLGTLEKLGT